MIYTEEDLKEGSYLERARKWNTELDCQRGCDYIYVASMKGIVDEDRLQGYEELQCS